MQTHTKRCSLHTTSRHVLRDFRSRHNLRTVTFLVHGQWRIRAPNLLLGSWGIRERRVVVKHGSQISLERCPAGLISTHPDYYALAQFRTSPCSVLELSQWAGYPSTSNVTPVTEVVESRCREFCCLESTSTRLNGDRIFVGYFILDHQRRPP